MADDAFCTQAWLLVGLTRSVPGVLEFAGGRFAFTTDAGRVFAAPASEVRDVRFPWYYFGGGVKLTVGGEAYRLSFVRPNGASDASAQLLARVGNPLALLTVGQKIKDIGAGRQAGKAWRAVLTAHCPQLADRRR